MGVGMGAAQEAGERKAQGGSGEFLPIIYWKDDRDKEAKEYKKIVRFLTDDVITCKIYGFIKGGDKNKGRDFIDPDSLMDENGKPIFKELEGERDYFRTNNIKLPTYKGDLKDAKDIASEQTLGFVVLREEYTEKVERNGKEVAVPKLRDKIEKREWKDKEGNEKSEEGVVFGVVKQSYKNFWSQLAAYYNRYGTICDRDYEITRKGNGTDTTYSIIRLDPADDLPQIDESNTHLLMEHYKPKLTLKDWIVPKAKYNAAAEWVGGAKQESGGGDSKPAEESSSTSDSDDGPVREPSSSTVSDLKKELEDFKA